MACAARKRGRITVEESAGHVVVGGGDVACSRVHRLGKLLELEVSVPLVVTAATVKRQPGRCGTIEPRRPGALGKLVVGEPANVPVRIGDDDVLPDGRDELERSARLFDRRRAVQLGEEVDVRAHLLGGPAKGQRDIILRVVRLLERNVAYRPVMRDEEKRRSLTFGAIAEVVGRPVAERHRPGYADEVDLRTFEHDAGRVAARIANHFLDVDVGEIHVGGGHAPGDTLVLTD